MKWNGLEGIGNEWIATEWGGMEGRINGMEMIFNGLETNALQWNGTKWSGMEWIFRDLKEMDCAGMEHLAQMTVTVGSGQS